MLSNNKSMLKNSTMALLLMTASFLPQQVQGLDAEYNYFKVNCSVLKTAVREPCPGCANSSTKSETGSDEDVGDNALNKNRLDQAFGEMSKKVCRNEKNDASFYLNITKELKIFVQDEPTSILDRQDVPASGWSEIDFGARGEKDAEHAAFVADVFRRLHPRRMEDERRRYRLKDSVKDCTEMIQRSRRVSQVFSESPGSEWDAEEVCAILRKGSYEPFYNSDPIGNDVNDHANRGKEELRFDFMMTDPLTHFLVGQLMFLVDDLNLYFDVANEQELQEDEDKLQKLFTEFPPSFGHVMNEAEKPNVQHFLMSYEKSLAHHSGVMRCFVDDHSHGDKKTGRVSLANHYYSCEEYHFGGDGELFASGIHIRGVDINLLGQFWPAVSQIHPVGRPTTRAISNEVLCGGKMGFECSNKALMRMMRVDESFKSDFKTKQQSRIEKDFEKFVARVKEPNVDQVRKLFQKKHEYRLMKRNCNTYARATFDLLLTMQKQEKNEESSTNSMIMGSSIIGSPIVTRSELKTHYKSTAWVIEQRTWVQVLCSKTVLVLAFILFVACCWGLASGIGCPVILWVVVIVSGLVFVGNLATFHSLLGRISWGHNSGVGKMMHRSRVERVAGSLLEK